MNIKEIEDSFKASEVVSIQNESPEFLTKITNRLSHSGYDQLKKSISDFSERQKTEIPEYKEVRGNRKNRNRIS